MSHVEFKIKSVYAFKYNPFLYFKSKFGFLVSWLVTSYYLLEIIFEIVLIHLFICHFSFVVRLQLTSTLVSNLNLKEMAEDQKNLTQFEEYTKEIEKLNKKIHESFAEVEKLSILAFSS